jgi:hypothetical protein
MRSPQSRPIALVEHVAHQGVSTHTIDMGIRSASRLQTNEGPSMPYKRLPVVLFAMQAVDSCAFHATVSLSKKYARSKTSDLGSQQLSFDVFRCDSIQCDEGER